MGTFDLILQITIMIFYPAFFLMVIRERDREDEEKKKSQYQEEEYP